MIYVISDLHGRLDSYKKLIETVSLKETDTLYLLGDMLDYGEDGIAILLDAMERPNVFPILGDHEFTAFKLLSRLSDIEKGKKDATPGYQRAFSEWLQKGGMPTVTAFRALNREMRDAVLGYLRDECAPYEEVCAGDRNYLLVHAGITGYEPGRELDDYEIRSLIHGGETFPNNPFSDRILVTGHVPTDSLSAEANGKVLITPTHIALDCGAAEGGHAACLCLDTLDVYYA